MARIIDFAAPVGQKAGPGRWNDLDMLEVGNGGMTFDEYGQCWSSRPVKWCLRSLRSDTFLHVEYLEKYPHSWKRRDQHGKCDDGSVHW